MTEINPASPSATADALPQSSTARARRGRRAGAVVGAVLANCLLWLVARALGVDFVLSDSLGTGVLGLGTVIVFTLVFGLLGWGTLAGLERFTRRARTTWTVIATVVLLLSLVPIFLEHATTGTRTALVLLHLAVAAVLIPALRAYPQRH
ncbi:MAG TPA: DUF6069 family protein [Pseudonocardiaceae bacterium]|jgi:hypothetical protein